MYLQTSEGSELGIRVYIDGCEVPANAVSITSTDNEVAMATITLVPLQSFLHIKPRAMVHIFYLLTDTSDDEFLVQNADLDINQYRRFCMKDAKLLDVKNNCPQGHQEKGIIYRIGDNVEDVKYKLMFTGEYLSYQFQKTAAGRQVVMTCADGMNYLEYLKQHMANYKTGGFEMIENAFSGVAQDKDKRTPQMKDATQNLTKWITKTKDYPSEGEGNSNPAGELCAITGLVRAHLECWTVGNIFFAKALVRHRIPDMIVGLKNDRTSDNIFSIKEFAGYLKKNIAISGRGQQTPIITVLKNIASYMFIKRSTILSPRFTRADGTENKFFQSFKSQQITPYPDEVARLNEKAEGGGGLRYYYKRYKRFKQGSLLGYYMFSPNWWYFTPPACNVIFPDRYTSFTIARSLPDEPTRLLMRNEEVMGPKSVRNNSPNVNINDNVPTVAGIGNDLPVLIPRPTFKATKLKNTTYISTRHIAPRVEAFEALTDKTNGWKADLHRVLLPHEKFVGLNIAFGWQAGLAGFASKAQKKKYVGMNTDYMFWMQRFAGRAGQISGPLNPHLIAGQSCLIIDEEQKGFHSYGFVQSITHSFSLEGASTSVQLLALRNATENVDIQGAIDGNPKGFADVVTKNLEEHWDTRYSMKNISKDFYLPILGTPCAFSLLVDIINDGILDDFIKNDVDFIHDQKFYIFKNDLGTTLIEKTKADLLEFKGIQNAQKALEDFVDRHDSFGLAPHMLWRLWNTSKEDNKSQMFLRHFRRIGYASIIDIISPKYQIDNSTDRTLINVDDFTVRSLKIHDLGFHFESLYSTSGEFQSVYDLYDGNTLPPPEYDVPLLMPPPHATYFEYSKTFVRKEKQPVGDILVIPDGKNGTKDLRNMRRADLAHGDVDPNTGKAKLGVANALKKFKVRIGADLTKTIFNKIGEEQNGPAIQNFLKNKGIQIKDGGQKEVSIFKQDDREKSYELDEELKERYNAVMKYCNELKSNGF